MNFRVVLCVLAFLATASCGGDKVGIASRNFTDEIQREQNLSLRSIIRLYRIHFLIMIGIQPLT